MKKKSFSALVCAAAFSLTASAESYTYTPGDTSLGNGAVTITYADGTTDIATLTANPSNNETITLTGGAATFAADATLALASSGTVSFAEKVTAKGALTLVRGDDVYREWTGTAMTTSNPNTPAFPDIVTNNQVSLTDVNNTWQCIHVVGGRPASNSTAGIASAGRYDYISGSIGGGSFVVLNRSTGTFTYSIRVQLSPSPNGLYARCRTGVRTPRRGLWPDLEERWPNADLWDGGDTNIWGIGSVARADRGIFGASKDDATNYGGNWLNYTSAMGLNTIILKRKGAVGGPMKVRFDGGASLGGTTTIPFGMEAIVAVVGGSDATTFSKTITGTGDFTLVPSSATVTTPEFNGFISSSKWQVLAYNRLLSSMTGIEGYMQGGGHNAGGTPSKCGTFHYHYDATEDTATCQFHYKRSEPPHKDGHTTKFVVAKLRQNGLNVEIAGVGQGYGNPGVYGTEFPTKNVTTDDYTVTSWSSTVATLINESVGYNDSTNFTSGYGIRKITATFNGGGTATISGNIETLYGGKFSMAGANGAKMLTLVSSTNGLPAGGEAHVGEGVLRLVTSGTPGLGTTKIVVHSGGDVRNVNNWQIGANQELVLDGGRYFGIAEAVYLNYATLSNAVMNNVGPRISNGTSTSYWRVIGTEPSTIGQFNSSATYDGVLVYGKSTASAARSGNIAFRIEVQDVTGDSDADCVLSRIRDAAGRTTDRSNYAWFFFEKYGPGTLKITGDSKELRLESKLYNGTLLLAGDNIMTNEVQFLGGNIAVDAGKHNDNLGQLTVSKPGTITVGAGGSLGFASFTASTNATLTVGEGGTLTFASFTPGANLAAKSILIDAPLTGNVLKFGADISSYKGYFRWMDTSDETVRWHVKQDENGYLHPVLMGTFISIR